MFSIFPEYESSIIAFVISKWFQFSLVKKFANQDKYLFKSKILKPRKRLMHNFQIHKYFNGIIYSVDVTSCFSFSPHLYQIKLSSY